MAWGKQLARLAGVASGLKGAHVGCLVEASGSARQLIVHLHELVEVDHAVAVLVVHSNNRLYIIAPRGEALPKTADS